MHSSNTLIAVDVGNSRIKLGRFDSVAASPAASPGKQGPHSLPHLLEPTATLSLPLADRQGNFDEQQMRQWQQDLPDRVAWLVASVHRQAADRLLGLLQGSPGSSGSGTIRQLRHSDFPLAVNVTEPQRVGLDRLAAAAAASHLRQPDRAAIVVDHGSAITVDLVDATGAFCGGAILAGMAMSAQALADQTDALPVVNTEQIAEEPPPVGRNTTSAMQAGLYWGTLGAVNELVSRIAADQPVSPDVLVTGGASRRLAAELNERTGYPVRHVPHLVLSGIALAATHSPPT